MADWRPANGGDTRETRNNDGFTPENIGTFQTNGTPDFGQTWTQFSGMPQQNMTDPSNSFAHWDVFTPVSPVGPSLGEMNPQEFISNYQHLLSAMSSSSTKTPLVSPGTSFGEGGTGTSCREVLPPVDGRSNTPQDISLEGRDLYADAMDKWTNFSTYDPFGTPESPLTKVHSSDSLENLTTPPTTSGKPTYSEMAKSLKAKTLKQQTSRDDSDVFGKKKNPDISSKGIKSNGSKRSHFSRQTSKGSTKADDIKESVVSPTSKYGLDQFEELSTPCEQTEGVGGVERLLTRKGSTSSISSGTSGVDDLQFSSRPESHMTRVRLPPDGSDEVDIKASTTTPTTKPFFDAKRIFQTKEKKCSNMTTPTSSASTVLNNGKPVSGTKSASSAPRKTTDYINNDLRDSRKRTNQNNAQSRDNDSKKQENGKAEKKSRHCSSSSDTSGTSGSTKRNRNRQQMFQSTAFDQETIGK